MLRANLCGPRIARLVNAHKLGVGKFRINSRMVLAEGTHSRYPAANPFARRK